MIRYNIPIGISEFEKIRKNDNYYVDKTELIQALVKTEPAEITLFTRPRRFEKTLVMSMLASFFDILSEICTSVLFPCRRFSLVKISLYDPSISAHFSK